MHVKIDTHNVLNHPNTLISAPPNDSAAGYSALRAVNSNGDRRSISAAML